MKRSCKAKLLDVYRRDAFHAVFIDCPRLHKLYTVRGMLGADRRALGVR